MDVQCQEMKEKMKSEYQRREMQVLNSKSDEVNVGSIIDILTVFLVRHSASFLSETRHETSEIQGK